MPSLALTSLIAAGTASQAQSYSYSFTLNQGYTLTNAYIICTLPFEAYAGEVPLTGSFSNGTYQGQINQGFPTIGVYFNLIAVYTDSTGVQRVAMSLPNGTATTVLNQNLTWDPNTNGVGFDTTNYFQSGLMPNEATTVSDLIAGGVQFDNDVYMAFNYMQSTDPVLQASGTNGTVIGFDGAQNLGSFTFQSTPEPADLIPLGVGIIGLIVRRHRK